MAYRDIEFLSARLPGPEELEEDCLILVHVRKVVGEIHYRICSACQEGVITGVDIDAHLHSTGIGTRALSHLRARHPGITWRSTLTMRATRHLMRRMRVPQTLQGSVCAHLPAAGR
ncbi:hypothetical protein [Streptomyces griseosporeus]|uniref:hypothetical protein n=1 Tax=Streptomyces griseosporeus TaxID=1910 RepID=UPI003700CBE2